ncbi:hypothetical protein I4Q68_000794 [Campylobacter lari]|nr:hypothetical protein [Campylobacter lari]EGQ5682268.1 hypothetical protein [Campylobacter lari]
MHKKINFDTTIKTLDENKDIVKNYLQENNIKNFIIINPFSITVDFTLNLVSFFNLIAKIRFSYPNINIIIPTYNDIHDTFIRSVKQHNINLLSEIYIFKNNDDILNLVELISQSKCIISPSTGPIHIASNKKSLVLDYILKRIVYFGQHTTKTMFLSIKNATNYYVMK